MSDNIIDIKGLTRTFKVSKREKAGFFSSLKSLAKREYTYVNAVNDVSFSIAKGEIRGLIGPNGAGKSTIIKILSGILYPSSGEVNVMGYKPWLQREEYVRKIGVVFGQKSQLVWDLPAIDTFHLNKKLYKIPDEVYNRNLEYFKEMLQLSEIINKPVRQLSLGERMKCEFVSAMLHEPGLVYLDEPTIGLDVVSKDVMRDFIRKVNQDKKVTFILTTHDLDDIEDLCQNITLINNGTIVFDDHIDKMKSYFSNKKVISVKFASKIRLQELQEFNVTKFDGLTASLEVDLSKTDVKSVINTIFERFKVHDIDIESVGIEEVIKHMYQN